MVGSSGWSGGRRVSAGPILLALAAAGVVGFGIARWAARPAAIAGADAAPDARPAPDTPAPAPPVTFAAPYAPSDPASVPGAPAARGGGLDRPRPAALAQTGVAPPDPGVPATPRPSSAPPAPSTETAYALQAVTEQDGQPVAIVNGQLVRVGDVLDGARILSIAPEAVEIEKNGRRIVLAF